MNAQKWLSYTQAKRVLGKMAPKLSGRLPEFWARCGVLARAGWDGPVRYTEEGDRQVRRWLFDRAVAEHLAVEVEVVLSKA